MKNRRITNFLAGKRYFAGLLMIIILLSSLPLIFISVFSYRSNAKMMEKQIFETSNNYLLFTVNSVETVFHQLQKTLDHFSTSPELINYQYFPNGIYYESITGEIKNEDKLLLYHYLFKKKDMTRLVSFLKNSNPSFHSVNYVDYNKNLVISSGGKELSIDEFENSDLGKTSLDIRRNQLSVENSIFTIEDDYGIKGRIIPLTFILNYSKNRLIVNIDIDTLYDNIIKDIDLQFENELIIYLDKDNFLYDNSSQSSRSFVEDIKTGNLGEVDRKNQIINLSGKKVLLTKQKSEVLGWNFYNIIKIDNLYTNLFATNKLIFSFTFILFVITLIISILEARRFYKPVNNLVKLVESKVEGINTVKNEILVIESALKNFFIQKEVMQEKIEENLMVSRERFISLLLDDQFTKKEILEGLEYFNVDIIPQDIIVLLISTNYMNSDVKQIEDKEFVKLSIIEIATGIIQERFKGLTVEVKEGLFVAVFNCNQEEMSSVYSLSTHIQQLISMEFNIRCSIGIGNYCSDIASVSKVYADLKQSMRRRRTSGKSNVFYLDDIRVNDDDILLYSREDEKLLNQYIKNRDINNAFSIFDKMISKISCQKDPVTFREVQYTSMQILSNLILLASEMGLDLEQCADSKRNLYLEIVDKYRVESITKWLKSLICIIIKKMPEEKVLHSNEYIIQVINIINNNYASGITLTSVADGLGLNASYLSRIFKENTGKTFMEYLTEVRMEQSKKMLLEEDIKVSTLSNLMGYSNANYFIRIFRKYTGVTPGEFRKSM